MWGNAWLNLLENYGNKYQYECKWRKWTDSSRASGGGGKGGGGYSLLYRIGSGGSRIKGFAGQPPGSS